MSACCNSASPPHEIQFNDRPPLPSDMVEVRSARESARLLDGIDGRLCSVPKLPLRDGSSARLFCSAPQSPAVDLRDLLVDLRHCQNDLFNKVMEQQQELRQELLALRAASRANTDAQGALQRCQEKFLAECRDLFPFPEAMRTHTGMSQGQAYSERLVVDVAEKDVMQQSDTEVRKKDVMQQSDTEVRFAEFVDGIHGVKQPAAHALGNPLSEAAASVQMQQALKAKQSQFVELQLHARKSKYAGQSCCTRIDHFLKSKEFEIAVALAIIANAFVMCWESQYQGLDVGFNLQYPGRKVQAKNVWPGAESAFYYLDLSFGSLFVVEFLVKIVCWGRKYFYDSRGRHYHGFVASRGIQGWNVLDFCCVAAFLSDKMASVSAVNPQLLRMLRLFRLFRLVRFLRFLESLDHLYVMTTAIAGLSKVLTWAIVLLTVMLLICNLFLVQILQATYFHEITASDLTEDGLKRHRAMYEYFGTCTRCMLSMFEITLGNWPPVARLLAEEVSEWFTIICVLHKLTVGFAVVGVITGIILQETFKVVHTDDLIMFRRKKHDSKVLRRKMKSLFDALDTEKDGKLNMTEFTAIGEDREIQIWLASLDLETDDLPALFRLIDTDHSGYITLDELIARMPRIKGPARGVDVLAMMQKLHLASSSSARRRSGGQQKTTSANATERLLG